MSEEKKIELKPCPFHESGCETVIATFEHPESGRILDYWVEADCGASGPRCENREDAIAKWNTRAHEEGLIRETWAEARRFMMWKKPNSDELEPALNIKSQKRYEHDTVDDYLKRRGGKK